jgi:alpha-ketoglutarate-dependent taurine dioxygenase
MNANRGELALDDQSVLVGCDQASGALPLVIGSLQSQPLLDWAAPRAKAIRSMLATHGAILFRGFENTSIEAFQEFIESLCGPLLPYTDRGTPRARVGDRIYTSTQLAPPLRVFMHNENSFACTVPGQLFFLCRQPAESGGATPLADVRKVAARIDPAIRRKFRDRQILYVRNFGRGLGMRWQDAFQTDDPGELEARCRREDIEFEWIDESRLRTRQRRPALAHHPVSGEEIWLNHAAVLHISTVETALREQILRLFDEADLPNNSYYGDGRPIEPEVMNAVRDAYERETVRFEWQAGDVLLLDNLLVAHGRDPYAGKRDVVVGMTGGFPWSQIGVPSK